MSALNEQFQQATEDAKKLPRRPDNDTMLRLYGLYKQSTMGDADPDDGPPNVFDFVAKAKHDAWLGLSGESKEVAMDEYVKLVEALKAKG